MNHTTFKRSLAFITVALITLLCAVSSQAEAQAKAPGEQGQLNQQFHKARENFLRKDFKDAASEIHQGAEFLKKEAARATDEGKQVLMESARELDKLANEVQKGTVRSAEELDKAFARSYYALARHDQWMASESWTRKAISETGQDLKAAAVHLESALALAGHRLEAGTESAIKEANQIGEKLEKGATWAASEVSKGINDIGKEIDEASSKVAFLTPFKSSSIQVSEKTGGPVDLSMAIIQVAKQNLPAVVYIEVTESQEVVNPFLRFENDPFFRRFFGIPKMPRKFKQEVKGLGSGMIIDTQGHILTNFHVAGGATKMEVTLADGNKYPARLVGGDSKTDLAVIHIAAKERLPHVIFGDSDKMEVGEWVVAIGAPRALEKTITQGIISAKHRRGVTDPTSYQDFMQTDAPINPGNSGGPLLNLYGEVIGVNAAIATESGGFEGIGFTIPSNMAVYVAKALIAHGKVERGWLGVTIRDLTPELAKSVHAETLKGSLIVDVVKGGPAEKAGMKKDDVLVFYRGKEIPDSSALRNEVAQTPIGTEAKITVLRNGKKEDLTVRIGSLEEATKILAASVKERLGVEVRPPNSLETNKYGLSPHQGVVIAWEDPKGPFKEAGFEIGDMILAVDDQPIEGMESFVDLVSLLKPKQKVSILALDHRTGNTGTVQVVVR
jgi:serine protease Do